METYEYYCSECNSPVKSEDTICPNCGVNLDEIVSDNSDRIIVLKIYSNEIDAQITVEHLRSHDVDAFISKDDSGSMRPHMQLTLGVRVMICESDFEKAREVLEAMNI